MATKGAEAKSQIITTLLNVFPGAFMETDKIVRIPIEENGEIIETKISMTTAKDVLGGKAAINSNNAPTTEKKPEPAPAAPPIQQTKLEPTSEEMATLQRLLSGLNL